jgi:hypothetical protein
MNMYSNIFEVILIFDPHEFDLNAVSTFLACYLN